MEFYEYLSEIGVTDNIIQLMKIDKIDESVVMLMSDTELGRYLEHKGHRVLAVHFCNKRHGQPNEHEGKISQRRKELFANIKSKLELSRRGKSLKNANGDQRNTKNNAKEDRKVEIGWCHYDKKVSRYVQVRTATGGGTRFPCLSKSATKDIIIDSVKKLFLPLANMKVHFELSLDVKGDHMVGENQTVGSLHEQLQVKRVRFYLLSTDLDDQTKNESALDSIMPPVENLSDECNINDSYASTYSMLSPTSEGPSSDVVEDTNEVVNTILLDSFPKESDAAAVADQTVYYTNMGTPTVWKKTVSAELYIHESLQDALFELSSRIEQEASERPNIVNVSRYDVLDGGLRAFGRKDFKPSNKLNVKFSGEQAIDNGGPTREFLRLANLRIKEKFFYGPLNQKYLMLSASALTEKRYELAGKLIAYSIAHRGPLPRYFGGTLYSVMVSGTDNTHSIEIDEDLLESPTRDHLLALTAAESPSEFYGAVDNMLTLVELSGCSGLVVPSRKDELLHQIKHFLIFGRMKEALEQFMVGLNHLGVLDMVRRCPISMKEAFTYEEIELDASAIECLFPVKEWSPDGSNRRRNEERAISHWNDYLIDAEDDDPQKLKAILKFATGSEEIPILGFNPFAYLGFKHREDSVGIDAAIEFPMANTCANMISLPILVDYKTFCDRMDAAISIESFTTE